jgi:hypothetical protein
VMGYHQPDNPLQEGEGKSHLTRPLLKGEGKNGI